MQISQDCYVTFHYSLMNDQKEILDDSHSAEPLPYLHGHGNILPALEAAMAGKEEGDRFQVELAAAQAYGEHDETLIESIDASAFTDFKDLSVGSHCEMEDEQGNAHLVKVIAMDEKQVTVDGNHPLAGQPLVFDVEVVLVRQATSEELESGRIHSA